HIPGSKNIPLQNIEKVESEIPEKDVPVFVHCYSGVRSGQAVAKMKGMGYSNVKNIGGISGYKGPQEK
ncbi:MAG: rhodanese-like domain-containing protein, partial [Firmicutes bacterium]|nr:rhodanese-like domain-containing protein [Bacillota bacterium]